MTDELGGKIMTRFVALREKTYSYFQLQMTVVKIKKQKAQKSVSQNENINMRTIKTVQKQLNLKIK